MTSYFDEKGVELDRIPITLDYDKLDSFDAEIVQDMDMGVYFLSLSLHGIFEDVDRASMNAILRKYFLTALPLNHRDQPDYEDLESQMRGYNQGLWLLHTWWHEVATKYGVSDNPRGPVIEFYFNMRESRA